MASSSLQWMIIKKNNSFLVHYRGTTLNREPLNMKGKNCFRYNGLVHRKAVGVEPTKDGRGVALVLKKSKSGGQPGKLLSKTSLTRGRRRSLNSIKKILRNLKYRPELEMLALRRASALLKRKKDTVAAPASAAKK